jgi:hypothetical protein
MKEQRKEGGRKTSKEEWKRNEKREGKEERK